MPMAECEEPYDGRLSRTVPRETGGETPPVNSTQPDNANKARYRRSRTNRAMYGGLSKS